MRSTPADEPRQRQQQPRQGRTRVSKPSDLYPGIGCKTIGVMVPARAVGYTYCIATLKRTCRSNPCGSLIAGILIISSVNAKTEIGTSRSKIAHRLGMKSKTEGGKNEARNRVIIGTADNWIRRRNH